MDSTIPVVSVIVPAFNAERVIDAALDSVVRQSFQNWEALVVDDASTDRTHVIAKGWGRKDPRIKTLQLSINGGPAAARNAAIREAKGRWIALLDADDTWVPDRLTVLVKQGEMLQADVISDRLLLRNLDSGKDLGHTWPWITSPQEIGINNLIKWDLPVQAAPLGWSHPIFRMEFLKKFAMAYDANERYGEDWLLLFECIVRGAKMVVVPEVGYVYSVRAGNSESHTKSDYSALIRIMERVSRVHSRRLSGYTKLLLRYRIWLFKSLPTYFALKQFVKQGEVWRAIQICLLRPAVFLIYLNQLLGPLGNIERETGAESRSIGELENVKHGDRKMS